MTDPQTYLFCLRDNLELLADVYRPKDICRAVILYFHGGGGIMGSRRDILGLKEYLDNGYAVVSPDYRLAPETKLKDQLADAIAAYQWLLKEGGSITGLDTHKVILAGFSFGGYLVQQLGTMLSPAPEMILSISGYNELMDDMYLQPSEYYRLHEQNITPETARKAVRKAPFCDGSAIERWHLYLYSRQQPAWMELVVGATDDMSVGCFSPIRHVTKNYPPVCLVHGLEDEDVPYRQSAAMASKLKETGVTYELITLRGRHGIGSDESVDAWSRIFSFLNTCPEVDTDE